MPKTKIALDLLLPTIESADDACVDRLADLLQAKAGIDSVHAIKRDAETSDRICIHYDPNVVSTGEVRELAKRAGAELDQRYGHWLSKSRSTHCFRRRIHRHQISI